MREFMITLKGNIIFFMYCDNFIIKDLSIHFMIGKHYITSFFLCDIIDMTEHVNNNIVTIDLS